MSTIISWTTIVKCRRHCIHCSDTFGPCQAPTGEADHYVEEDDDAQADSYSQLHVLPPHGSLEGEEERRRGGEEEHERRNVAE